MEKKIRNPFSMKCVYAGPEQMGKLRPAPADDPPKQEQKTQETNPRPAPAAAGMVYAGPTPNPQAAYPMNFAVDPNAPNPMTPFMTVYAGPPTDPKAGLFLSQAKKTAPAKGDPAPFCRVCGNKFPENAKFCTECGSPRTYVKTCPSCAAKVPADCGFCIFCGSELAEKAEQADLNGEK